MVPRCHNSGVSLYYNILTIYMYTLLSKIGQVCAVWKSCLIDCPKSISLTLGVRWMLKTGWEGRRQQNSLRQASKPLYSVSSMHSIVVYCHAFIEDVIFAQLLPACNTGTAQWKSWFQAHIVEQLELSHCGWIMGIGPREPKCPTFCARHFFQCLRIACTKMFTVELMNVSGL